MKRKRYFLPNDELVIIIEVVGAFATVKRISGDRKGTRAVCDLAKLRAAKSR